MNFVDSLHDSLQQPGKAYSFPSCKVEAPTDHLAAKMRSSQERCPGSPEVAVAAERIWKRLTAGEPRIFPLEKNPEQLGLGVLSIWWEDSFQLLVALQQAQER